MVLGYRELLLVFVALFTVLNQSVAEQNDGLTTRVLVKDLTAPIDIADLPDGSGRRLLLDQSGVIYLMLADDTLATAPFLDIRDRILPLRQDFEERGLLGMAVHPDFKVNGRVFITYSAPLENDAPSGWNHTRRVSEFSLAADSDDHVDATSERILIRQHWPSRKHNGGALGFGPDGYLYIGFGDGGGIHGVGAETLYDAFSVPARNRYWDQMAQDLHSLYGKILRIDVDQGYPGYAIPADNPLVGRQGKDEIFAWGFRNPYRLSFDGDNTGTFYVAAVAETFWESVYQVPGPGNYGWPIREGSHCFSRITPLSPPDDCASSHPDREGETLVHPIIEYPNMSVHRDGSQVSSTGVGTAVVGAIRVRGNPLLGDGDAVLVADWSLQFEQPSGQLLVATPGTTSPWPLSKLLQLNTRIVSLDQDEQGRIYILTNENFGPYGQTGAVLELLAN